MLKQSVRPAIQRQLWRLKLVIIFGNVLHTKVVRWLILIIVNICPDLIISEIKIHKIVNNKETLSGVWYSGLRLFNLAFIIRIIKKTVTVSFDAII